MNAIQTRRRGAFTLIELIAVMVISAIIVLAVTGPTLAYIDSIRTRSAAARIVCDIRYVQRQAMSARTRTWMVLNASNETYQLYAENPASPGKAGRQALTHPLSQSSSSIQFGSGLFANVGIASVNINGTSEIEFDSFGIPYDGSAVKLSNTGTITLTNGITLTIYPVSGIVEYAG